jgi:tRNA dimethylallyltransferase
VPPTPSFEPPVPPRSPGLKDEIEHKIEDPLLVVVLGPTASGKSALAITMAERFGGEIVNCDSIALYRELDIGCAKPSGEDRARVLHHLLDVLSPDQPSNAGDYGRRTREAIAEIAGRGKLPIVAGGTGLYLRALLEGLFSGPPRSEELRQRLRDAQQEHGRDYLHRLLLRLDAGAAANIHANDTPKLIRAIEVCLSSRKKMTELWQHGRDPLRGYRTLRIGLNPERNALYARINERAKQMLERGLVEETRRVLEQYGDRAVALNSTGYRQVVQFLRGEIDRKTMIWAAQQAHRNYAKRQMTWFRREPEVQWFAGFGDDAQVQEQVLALVQPTFLAAARRDSM